MKVKKNFERVNFEKRKKHWEKCGNEKENFLKNTDEWEKVKGSRTENAEESKKKSELITEKFGR